MHTLAVSSLLVLSLAAWSAHSAAAATAPGAQGAFLWELVERHVLQPKADGSGVSRTGAVAVAAPTSTHYPADPDLYKDMGSLPVKRGYASEEHFVTTEDGYILGVFRLSRTGEQAQRGKPAVLLQHGLLDSAFTWANNFQDQSLAYLLVDAGYEVWLGNNRGVTFYSKRHVDLSVDSDEFWAFSYDEMAKYDLPAMIKYIVDFTGQESISYVGHSEGTTQAFAGFSLEENADILPLVNLFVALAPATYVYNQESRLLEVLADLDIALWLELLGVQEFLPADSELQVLAPEFCQVEGDACLEILAAICGPSVSLNESRVQVYVSETPAGTSTQNLMHWTQGVKEDKFQMMDFGAEKNMERYGQSTPPQYNLSAITAPPVAIFSGTNDYLADPDDVAHLIEDLSDDVLVFQDVQDDYAHLDFTWAENANERIYGSVIDLIKEYNPVQQ